MNELQEDLIEITQRLPTISSKRKYWLIRTQSGNFYESYLKFGFIALGYDLISLYQIQKLKQLFKDDNYRFLNGIKEIVAKSYPEDKVPGLAASQISRFIYDIKKDDIVVIPSQNSKHVAFGVVTDSALMEVDDILMDRTECPYKFRKSIQWRKTQRRSELDPFLYKLFQAHQAINNVSTYAEIIERTLNSFFITDNEAHLILEVEKQDDVYAKELFTLGLGYLQHFDEFAAQYGLDMSSNEIEVKITLNSPGKIHFKGLNWNTVVLFGLIIIAVNGGGLTIPGYLDLSTRGILKAVTDYQNAQHDRVVQDQILQTYKDSLKVRDPKDLIELIKQSSVNKNVPK